MKKVVKPAHFHNKFNQIGIRKHKSIIVNKLGNVITLPSKTIAKTAKVTSLALLKAKRNGPTR